MTPGLAILSADGLQVLIDGIEELRPLTAWRLAALT